MESKKTIMLSSITVSDALKAEKLFQDCCQKKILSREDITHENLYFESECKDLKHTICERCKRVSLDHTIKNLCTRCNTNKKIQKTLSLFYPSGLMNCKIFIMNSLNV